MHMHFIVCVRVGHVCPDTHVEVRGQPLEVGSFLPLCESQRLNSGLVVSAFTAGPTILK